MEAVPLRPLGERRLAELQDVLSTRVEAWLRRWSMEASSVSLRLLPWQPECRDTAIAGNASGRAGVSLIAVDAEAFGAWLAQAPRTGGQGLPARLAAAAIDDLRVQLLGAGAKVLESPEPPAERHGFHFAATLDAGFELRVLIDRTLVDRLVPPAKAPKRPLTPRAEATSAVPVACTFALDLGTVPVADVLGLAPGDVLVGQATLDALLQCRVGDSATPHTFRLIRHGRRFAAMAQP
jgi:hypothetical protein